MWGDFVYAFGIGLTFIIGIFTGTAIAGFISIKVNREGRDELFKHYNKVEERLVRQVEFTGEISRHLADIAGHIGHSEVKK